MKLLSLFSGIGAFEKALDNLRIDYELVAFSEIDKYATKSYCAIHDVDESKNLGDITKVDEKALPKDIDLVVYGFPCQDISNAGKMKGLFNEDGTPTRSGLFFEALRIIKETKPRVAIAENVKNLTGKKFKEQFGIVLESLENAGYNNYWKVLNAKDYGIPQNRERVFIVSIRKDIDNGMFQFPEGFELELRLKDVLEDEVDEKFYIEKKCFGDFISEPKGADIKVLGYMTGKNGRFERHQSNTVYSVDGLCPTQYAGQHKNPFRIKEPCVKQVGQMHERGREMNPQSGRIYDADGVSPTLDSCGGGNRMPKILVREATKKGYAEAVEGDSINFEQPNSKTRRGRVGKQVAQTLTTSPQQGVVINDPFVVASRGRYTSENVTEQRLEPNREGICNALTTVQKDNLVVEPNVLTPKRTEYGKAIRKAYESGEIKESRHNMTELQPRTDGVANTLTTVLKDSYVAEPTETTLRIRKLTPKECFRLMGFADSDFEKAEAVNSNTQLYKQAGNSIVVPVVEHIIRALFDCGALEK